MTVAETIESSSIRKEKLARSGGGRQNSCPFIFLNKLLLDLNSIATAQYVMIFQN